MTDEQEFHLRTIKEHFAILVDSKYRKGQAEHGGNLMDMPVQDLLSAALDEAIDQVVYLITLMSKL